MPIPFNDGRIFLFTHPTFPLRTIIVSATSEAGARGIIEAELGFPTDLYEVTDLTGSAEGILYTFQKVKQ